MGLALREGASLPGTRGVAELDQASPWGLHRPSGVMVSPGGAGDSILQLVPPAPCPALPCPPFEGWQENIRPRHWGSG